MASPSKLNSSEAKTSIDSLIELLTEKGKLDLNTIAITLGISPTIVEGWAKVLENGKLIRISYEVGKMYLELQKGTAAEQGHTAGIKIEAQKSILQSEMEVEKITLDKFSRNLDELATTAERMEAIYKQKMPNVQRLFAELDIMSAPMAKKTKELEAAQKAADMYFSQLDRKTEALYAKIEVLEHSSTGGALKQKGAMLKIALSRADQAKAALLDLEDTRQALYTKVSDEIDKQVKEFKVGLKASVDQIYADLKIDATEAAKVEKDIKAEMDQSAKIFKEGEKMKREAEDVRLAVTTSRVVFKEGYQKIIGDLQKMYMEITPKYRTAQAQLEALKASMGEIAKLHDSVALARDEIKSIDKEIQASRANVSSILETLKTLDLVGKKMAQVEKAQALAELSNKVIDTKQAQEHIKQMIKGANASLKTESEGK